jgi:hypothetical protein
MRLEKPKVKPQGRGGRLLINENARIEVTRSAETSSGTRALALVEYNERWQGQGQRATPRYGSLTCRQQTRDADALVLSPATGQPLAHAAWSVSMSASL